MRLVKTTLNGPRLRLEALCDHHSDGLQRAINDGELWRLGVTLVPTPKQVPVFIQQAEQDFRRQQSLGFATIIKKSNRLVGSTRFMKIDLANKKAEIGFTFLAQSWQRSFVNTEAKYLMLQHAFENLALNRVELITDCLNEKSRNAILRLGAQQEALMRSHMVMRDGRVRDSVLYSIVKSDWPKVKANLQVKLA